MNSLDSAISVSIKKLEKEVEFVVNDLVEKLDFWMFRF